MASSAAFDEAYGALNTAQKQAVDTIEGPVMVVAGPGTGKTQILTLRIANILLKTDTQPEQILALTFTESGARAMRERLRGYIGSEAYRIPIHTFHGFAGTLIAEYPEAYERIVGGRPASDLEKIEIYEQILDDPSFKVIRPMSNPYINLGRITEAIKNMKKEYVAPDALAQIIAKQEKELGTIQKVHEKGAHKGKTRSEYNKKEKNIEKNRELLNVYRAYEAALIERGLFDYEDMILETVHALERDEAVLRELQETYHYLLADEHQDVNASQNRILELLASYHEHPNIFVVGDEKQAIYRFQGASLENFLYFEDAYPKTKTIALTENYRSGQSVLDAAHSLIAVDAGPAKELRVPLSSKTNHEATIERRDFSHESVEDAWVVRAIETRVRAGEAPEELAIIVRTNQEVEHYAALLRKAAVPVTASADGDILTHPITHAVCALIDAVVKPASEAALVQVLHAPYWGIAPADLVRVFKAHSYDRPLIGILSDPNYLKELGVSDIAPITHVSEVLDNVRTHMVTEPAHRTLERLLEESGLLAYVMHADVTESARIVRRLYDEVEEMVRQDNARSLAGVSEVLERYRVHNLPLNAPYIATQQSAVQVMTAHKAKGLEFSCVFVPHLTDSRWGKSKRNVYFDIPLTKHVQEAIFDALDDERRLLYVTMTRAKRELFLSVSETDTDGRAFTPSRLLADIDEQYIATIPTDKEAAQFDSIAELRRPLPSIEIDPALLRDVLLERGLSATALNNYLKSPWEYFYKNLLRIPEVQPPHLQFGTAVHGVLEHALTQWSTHGALPNPTEIKTLLDRELGKLPLSDNEFARLHERGYEALISYLEHIKDSLPASTKEEFTIRVTLPTGDETLPEVPLTGKLDRLDFDPDGRLVRVVDYKTGKPKTKGQIEGTTKDSNGNEKRQLTFYALLLSLYDDERYAHDCDMTLAFVEPDSKGDIREVTYRISDEEVAALKGEIIRVANEIAYGTFLDVPCDAAVTSYCEFAEALRRSN